MTTGIATLFITTFLFACSTEHQKLGDNGFDTACIIFEEASKTDFGPEELGIYIATRLNNMPDPQASKDVKEIYHALFNVAPAKRYELFKESAEITLGRNWDCPAMKQLYQRGSPTHYQ